MSFVVETAKETLKEDKSFEELFCGKNGSKESTKILSWENEIQHYQLMTWSGW